MRLRACLVGCVILLIEEFAPAQRPADYDHVVVQQNRIDARELGYPPLDVIPNGESAITSLTVAPNGNVYGATSGMRSHLFLLNPRHGYVQPLGFLPGTMAVSQALAVSSAGEVYIGTTPGGHLLKYTPKAEDGRAPNVGEPCPVTDLGQPVAGEFVSALAIDRSSDALYGLTSPNAHFFRYSIEKGEFLDLGVVARGVPQGEKFEAEKLVSKMLAIDDGGNVFCSGEDGKLFRYDRKTEKLSKLSIHAPTVPGREPWTRVDAWLVESKGSIFGGTSDGYLFRLDPEKLVIQNLGKPLLQYHIAGLVKGPNGKIYGVGGDEDELARLFSYDPATAAYEILGFVDVNRRPYYTWQAYVVRAMAGGLDGTVYIGAAERISRLYLFYPF
jgi:sugar lactone lactonase YvrE